MRTRSGLQTCARQATSMLCGAPSSAVTKTSELPPGHACGKPAAEHDTTAPAVSATKTGDGSYVGLEIEPQSRSAGCGVDADAVGLVECALGVLAAGVDAA